MALLLFSVLARRRRRAGGPSVDVARIGQFTAVGPGGKSFDIESFGVQETRPGGAGAVRPPVPIPARLESPTLLFNSFVFHGG